MDEHYPILIIGAGALGGAILKGLKVAGLLKPEFIMVCDLNPSDEVRSLGLILNPPLELVSKAKTIILAVKPQIWRKVAADYKAHIDKNVTIISVMAGVRTTSIAEAFGVTDISRVMPTTGVATSRGVASIFALSARALKTSRFIFEAIATTVVLDNEDLIDAATAVSGSGPAYVYAFVRALEKAANLTGLKAEDAKILARATLISAANLLDVTGEDPDILIKRVTSPGGTTEAALQILCSANGIDDLLERSIMAALDRAKALG
jgi:pyrroline-5-carboxylate reductase